MLTRPRETSLEGEFAAIDFAGSDRIVVAVSGGSDSTALLLKARDHFAASGETARLIAVTIDHRLRAEAADEARQVQRLCATLGVEHRTMHWDDPKRGAGIQNAARGARYALLGTAAKDAGASIVLTGHTLDDQIETVAMRARRGEGRGLSGIAPATLHDRSVWFVRPLLQCRRSALRDDLRSRKQGWIDDPSNENSAFERVRTRADLTDGDAARLLERAKRADAGRRSTAREAARLISDRRRWEFNPAERSASLDRSLFDDRDASRLALSAVLAWVGRSAYLPSGAVVARAAEFISESAGGKRLTVSGCLLEQRAGRVHLKLEQRNSGAGQFAFDGLVPLPDWPLADALAERTGAPRGPKPPFFGYPDCSETPQEGPIGLAIRGIAPMFTDENAGGVSPGEKTRKI